MNKNLIFIGIVILALAAGGFLLIQNITQPEISERENSDVSIGQEQLDPEKTMKSKGSDMSAESMDKMIAEGETIMAMGGKMNPSVIYASPGKIVKIANHESYDLTLVAEDGSFVTELVASGKDGSFAAPERPGKYVYYSSARPAIKGTLIVEE